MGQPLIDHIEMNCAVYSKIYVLLIHTKFYNRKIENKKVEYMNKEE